MNNGLPREALFWNGSEDGKVVCGLCPRGCVIALSEQGFCGVRRNISGRLFASGYGALSAVALDPIEKKPLRMFRPGSHILSLGGFGCNMCCPFCQNSDISLEFGKRLAAADRLTPRRVAGIAEDLVAKGNIGAAYTYNEPTVMFEYILDCAGLIREKGLLNVVVTNGYINPGPLSELLELTDAMNIDLKGFDEKYYSRLGGSAAAVKKSIELAAEACHVEVTTLVIPGENEDDTIKIAKWLSAIDPGIPLHLSAFYPRFLYSGREPTPPHTVLRLAENAGKYLRNVFTGNI